MTPVPVEVSRPALNELVQILYYVRQRSPKNAQIILDAFEDVLSQLALTPTIGHVHPEIDDDAIRFVPFKSFEAAYRFEDGKVSVISVIYAARDYTKIDWR